MIIERITYECLKCGAVFKRLSLANEHARNVHTREETTQCDLPTKIEPFIVDSIEDMDEGLDDVHVVGSPTELFEEAQSALLRSDLEPRSISLPSRANEQKMLTAEDRRVELKEAEGYR